jgi:hypothetical protein
MDSLRKLQDAIIADDKGAIKEVPLSGIFSDVISDDLYGTLEFATNKKYGDFMDPDELLVDAVDQTLERGDDILQLVGLAIKNGATPNMYVTVNYETNEGFQDITVLHIIVYAWRRYLDMPTDYRNLMKVVALLCAAGADVMLPVTNPTVLIERKRKENRNASAAEIMSSVGKPKSVLAYIMSEGKKEEVDLEVEEDEEEEASYLSDVLLRYIAIFTAFRTTLGDVKDVAREDYFVASSLHLKVYISEAEVADMTVIAERIGLFLDNPYSLTGFEGDQKLLECVGIHANRCAKKLLDSNTITIEGAKAAFFEAIRSFNGTGAKLIVEFGLFITYNMVSVIIFLARLKTHEQLQLSAEFQTGILLMLVERGTTLDREQLGELSSFSETSFNAVMDEQDVPYWRRACSAPGAKLRSDVRELARELNIDPDMDRKGMCEALTSLSEGGQVAAKSRTARKTRADVGNSLTRTEGLHCENEKLLAREISDYSRLDLHVIRDSGNGKNYCFESVDYPKILRSGVNVYTDNPISETDLQSMQAKYNTLTALGLPLESTGITEALKKLGRNTGGSADYELWVRARRDHFLNLISSAPVGIDQDLFIKSERNGGLTIQEMEAIIDTVGDTDEVKLSPMNNREHALRDFALTFMEYLDDAQDADDPIAAVEGLFDRLKEAISLVVNVEEEEPVATEA